jgi:hypothetical protein
MTGSRRDSFYPAACRSFPSHDQILFARQMIPVHELASTMLRVLVEADYRCLDPQDQFPGHIRWRPPDRND